MDALEFFNNVKEADKKYDARNKNKKSCKKKSKCNIPLEHLLMYQEL